MPSIAICTQEGHGFPHAPLTLYADSTHEVPVRADQDHNGYIVSNFYADGIKGVSIEDLTEAQADDEPMCAEHRCLIDHWEYTEEGEMP